MPIFYTNKTFISAFFLKIFGTWGGPGLVQNRVCFSFSRPYFDPKYMFGVNLVKDATVIQTLLKKHFFEFSVAYHQTDISTENSKDLWYDLYSLVRK